jgi:hypothetical protein
LRGCTTRITLTWTGREQVRQEEEIGEVESEDVSEDEMADKMNMCMSDNSDSGPEVRKYRAFALQNRDTRHTT